MQQTLINLAKQVEQKRYGKYRAFVVDNQDPEKRARLKLRVPSVLGEQISDWALPCLPFGGGTGYGLFMVPNVDAQLWMEYEEGDIDRPIWTGTFWQQMEQVPPGASKIPPTSRILQTPAGHLLQFDDSEGEEQIRIHHPSEAEILIDPNGTLNLTDAQGAKVRLDAKAGEISIEDANGNTIFLNSSGTTVEDMNSNKIEMSGEGIKVEGKKVLVQSDQVMLGGEGGEPLIKGQSFLSLFASHTHPTALGPSGPPLPQGEMSTLSGKVTSG